jgi:hypothetical protein
MSGQDTPAGDGTAIASGLAEDATPAGAGGSMTPAGVRGGAPPAGKVISRRTLTYLGQPAEEATISSSAGFARVRVVRFGSSAYALEGFGNTPASFAHDYNVLLGTFTPHP